MTGSGTLPLAVADLGISRIDTLKEMDGKRQFAVTLYNSSDYKLKGSGKKVKLGVYDTSAYTPGAEVVDIVTVSNDDELSLIDNGAYTVNLDFDIKAYLAGQGKDEILENGVTLYVKVWVADKDDKELSEFVGDNNYSTILCENLMKRNGGNRMKVDVEQSNSDTETTAVLTLQNLAMAEVENGNVAVNLLDEGGNIIRTRYLSNTAEGLVALGSEGVISKTFVFDTLGADVEAYYFNATADSMNADLQTLAASGVGVNFDKNITTYDNLKVNNLKSTNITAVSANPNAKVVLKDAGNAVLAQGTGAVAYTLPLSEGSNTFKVTVEPDGAGAQPKTYEVTIVNEAPTGGNVTLASPKPGTRGWWNESSVPVILTAAGLTNFIPTKVLYKINDGEWTSKDYTGSPLDITAINSEGIHVISAKLQDANGYNLTADSLTVKVDRTAPVFARNKTTTTLSKDTLTVSAEVTDALSGIYSVVMTRGNETFTMEKQGGTATYSTSITADSLGVIKITATDMAGNTAVVYTGDIGSSDGGDTYTPPPAHDTSDSNAEGTHVYNVPATVTAGTNGSFSVSMKASQAVILKQPERIISPFGDLSRIAITAQAGPPVTISPDGTIKVQDLSKGTNNRYNITYDLGNGQTIIIGTMEIVIDGSGNAEVTTTLIDPYGIIIDADTGQPIEGVNVTLYYADTERNRASEKTPHTVVSLPGIPGFEPNDNKNPQISDKNGAYGFMVFPTSDYYIVAEKEGYDTYRSMTIPVEYEIVRCDFKMNKPSWGEVRLSGSTRVDTALAIAKASFTGRLSNVILATADNYPDALAGSVLAYKLNAPILLVGSSAGDQEKVIDYLKSSLNPEGTVYILGGTSVVSSAMENKVAAEGFKNIIRIGGSDRYDTSVKIADELNVKVGTPVVLAYGENYPDTLSISSIAAQMQVPILLVGKDGLSQGVEKKIAKIKPTRVYIIGGEGVISKDVEERVSHITALTQENIVRIKGEDRYETSLAVAKYFNLAGQKICIATGQNFPDALTGSVYAANYNISIILADDRLSDEIMDYLKDKEITGAALFGGEAVVSKDIERQLIELTGK